MDVCKICPTRRPSASPHLSHATLRGGGSVYLVANHPWICMGRKGRTEIFRLLSTNVRELDAIVVGRWNRESWADELFQTKPIWKSYRLQGASRYTIWDTAGFANFLQDMGLSG
eukprot:UN1127